MATKRTVSAVFTVLLFSTLSCDKGGTKTPVEPPFQGRVEGVVSADESTLSGVTVQLTGGLSRTAQTSTTGAFSFPGLPAGTYVVEIVSVPEDFVFEATSKSASVHQGKGSAKVDFKGAKKRDGLIGGLVSMEGAGMAGVTVVLNGPESSSSASGSEGGFEFSQLPRGTYQVSISGFDPAVYAFPAPQQTATVKNGNRVEVLFSGTLVPYPPAPPTDLAALVAGSSSILLSWTDESDDETRFEVHRIEGVDGSWSQIGAPAPNTEGFEDLGLVPNTTYRYRVNACNDAGCSDFTSEAEATTDEVAPEAPTNLTATATGPFSVALTWTDESGNETRFEIERKEGSDGGWESAETADADATALSDTGLGPNTNYVYRVRACNDVGCSAYSDETDTTTDEVAPEAPFDLTAGATGSTTVSLTWKDGSDNETTFEVERKTGTGGNWAQLVVEGPDATSFNDAGLTPNTSFLYRVRACNEVGCSDYSNEATVSTNEVVPDEPTGLTATASGPTAIQLAWTDASINETGFRVERKRGSFGNWTQAETPGANATGVEDTGLSSDTRYYYRLQACNDVGCSDFSDEANATTDDVPPVAPSNLAASATGSSTVSLSWTDRSNNEDRFRLERKEVGGGSWSEIGTRSKNVTTYPDTELDPNTSYLYRARACNEVDCSPYSDDASETTWDLPPESPTSLAAVATGQSSVDLSWTDMADSEDGFRVERREGAGSFATAGTVGEDEEAFSDTGLSPNTTYSYRVLAYNPSGDSPASNTADATTEASSGPNLTIANLYLTQSTQTLSGDVPLVADKNGYLRVFAVASETNSFQPSVRVRFYLGGTLAHTEVIASPGSSVPTSVQESSLGASWNVGVPASLIQPGLSILADVDPTDQVTEGDEGDNLFPTGGSPLAMDVRTSPTFNVTFIPIRQSVNNLVGDVSTGNAADFLEVTLRMLPIAQANVELHTVYTTDALELESGNENGAWGALVSEIRALRMLEGSDRYYYGVPKVSYGGGTAGMGYIGYPAAIGWDKLPSGSGVAAHEWGHNWRRYHAEGCGAGNPDGSFPYADGKIGVWGLDVGAEALKSPSTHYDFMSYCGPDWISDYSYKAILDYREAQGGMAGPGQPEPTLLVWGRVEGGQIIMEPAFEVTTAPHLPTGTGEYLLEAEGVTGESLFSMAFQPIPVSDGNEGDGHFAFAIPLRSIDLTSLSRIRVSGGGHNPGLMESRVGPQVVAPPEPEFNSQAGSVVEMSWDGALFPMALVQDPATGEVLSFARTGRVNLSTSAREVEVIFSDGLKTTERIRRRVR